MKDSEFIELLNLYLDHEISADDAVRLEAEVQTHPARRRIYQDYCRMQKACKVLAQDFPTETPVIAEKKIVPFRPEAATRAARGNAFYTVGAVAAAAACLAIIFVGRSREQQQQSQAAENAIVAAQPVAPAATEVKVAPVTIDTPEARARAGAAFAATPLRRVESAPTAFVAANALFLSPANAATPAGSSIGAQQANDQFAWLSTNLGLVPLEQQLQLEQLRLQTAAMTLQPEGQALGNKANRNQPPASEMATFQFTLGR